MLYAQGMYIMETPFSPSGDDNGKQTLYIPGQTAVGIDADCLKRYFYWSDVTGKTISRAKLDGTDSSVIVRNLGSPEGVAIDWLSENVYWTDSGLDRIDVARLDGTSHKTLFSTDLVNPRSIAVDPIRGVMFWTDWNRDAPKVEKASMDGTERTVLVNDGLGLPNGLTIDFDSNNVCWADAGTHKVECVNYDGRNRRVIVQTIGYPFGLVYNSDLFYWTDWERSTLPNANRNSGRANEELTLPFGANGKLYGIATVRSACPAGSNQCAYNKGGCRHLCLPNSGGGRTCACPEGVSPRECGNNL
jgi:nidogen (entactin)